MIADRVWETKFWNVHQSSFSIPGMRGRRKRKQLRAASSPKWQRSALRDVAAENPLRQRFPQPAQVCWTLMDWVAARMWKGTCVLCMCLCLDVWQEDCVSDCRRVHVCWGQGRRQGAEKKRESVRERERARETRRQWRDKDWDGERRRAPARGMTLSTGGIGLFKTQGLDEYGTAAVGWLRGGRT